MASALTTGNLFEAAYLATAAAMKAGGFTSGGDATLVSSLKKVVGPSFEPTHASALRKFRLAIANTAAGGSPAKSLMALANAGNAAGTQAPTADQVSRVAALTLLRHTHYWSTMGSQRLWIVSMPTKYQKWPHQQFTGMTATRLRSFIDTPSPEVFSPMNQRHIAHAAQTGLAWTHKALKLLDDIGPGSRGERVLKRWFSDGSVTDAALAAFASKLRAGLKKIVPKLNGGALIVTDFVPIRGSGDANDKSLASANAFVTGSDKHCVIYIEKGFFSHSAKSVFQNDGRHWARIMVHEMTHREAATVDKRYGWAGIKPGPTTLTPAEAMVNADSWAIFVANAANAMTNSDIVRAQNGT